jgi:hypothetical protein
VAPAAKVSGAGVVPGTGWVAARWGIEAAAAAGAPGGRQVQGRCGGYWGPGAGKPLMILTKKAGPPPAVHACFLMQARVITKGYR